jgi:hypothetical protein
LIVILVFQLQPATEKPKHNDHVNLLLRKSC